MCLACILQYIWVIFANYQHVLVFRFHLIISAASFYVGAQSRLLCYVVGGFCIYQPYCQYHQQARIQPCHIGGSFYSDFGPFPGLTIGLTSGCLGETSILQFVFVLSTELVLRDVFGHTESLQ